ncbi:hypothetical protein [Bradyrhizobium brasilense]|uniref:hypothetical protein n=1 Tax=Bradyrhizobium brasilense TaxID=1419277 RepID=UPI0013017BC9|nr:hypothetical protein [Bradyrhizobium brasilense]
MRLINARLSKSKFPPAPVPQISRVLMDVTLAPLPDTISFELTSAAAFEFL